MLRAGEGAAFFDRAAQRPDKKPRRRLPMRFLFSAESALANPARVWYNTTVTDLRRVGISVLQRLPKPLRRVRLPYPAPARRKRYVACDEPFHFIIELIARIVPRLASKPNPLRWAPVWGRRFAAVLPDLERISILTIPSRKKDRLFSLSFFWGFAGRGPAPPLPCQPGPCRRTQTGRGWRPRFQGRLLATTTNRPLSVW